MRAKPSRRPSPAMIVAIIALVCALTGTAWAALGKNSVGSKQLKKNAVTTAKIKKGAVTGVKVKNDTLTGAQINEETLGAVPLANTVPPNQLHVVGAAGEPPFQEGTHNLGGSLGVSLPGASFIKDHDNIVHLEGVIEIPPGTSTLPVAYQLPPGFRPPAGQLVIIEQNETTVIVAGSNVILEGHDLSGDVLTNREEPDILTGFSFVAGS